MDVSLQCFGQAAASPLVHAGLFWIDELRKKGIKNRPMPVGLIYDIKRDPSGSWDKDKSRLVMRGHQWNMSKSFGFDHKYETFAATPDLATTRMMQAIMVLYNWTALAFCQRAGTGAAARVHRRRSHEPIVRCNGGLRRVVEGFKAATKHI